MFVSINGGKLPVKSTKYSAGVDVYANEDVTIGAGETAIVGLGIAIDLEAIEKIVSKRKSFLSEEKLNETMEDFFLSHYISLKPRSSLRAKGLISHSAVIDLDYKNEIKMVVHYPYTEVIYKVNDKSFKIKKGDRIGQLLLMEHKGYLFRIESEEERTGGFGSTGDK